MAAPPELIAALTRLGFSQYEAQAYAALAGQRPMNGSEVSKRAGMPPSKIYETLARLEAKGAVLVSRSEPVRYSAVPHADVLASLRARFDADLGTATAALDQLPSADEPGLVWSLHDKGAIDRAFIRVITAARAGIFAGIWDEELDQLGPHLEAASQRGIETHVAIYGKRILTGPRTYDLSECGASARLRLSGRRLAVVVADDSDTAVAEFGDRTPDEAVLTTNRVTSLLAVEYVKADISGRLLINALGETAYQQLLATPDMRAVMATVEPRNPRLAPGHQPHCPPRRTRARTRSLTSPLGYRAQRPDLDPDCRCRRHPGWLAQRHGPRRTTHGRVRLGACG